MHGKGFLHAWLERLRPAVEQLPEKWRLKHLRFLLTKFLPEGGFAGRQGGVSPYYTSFGLRGLFLLGGLEEKIRGRCREYLRSLDPDGLSPADLFAAVFSAHLLGEDAILRWDIPRRLGLLARPDGGFALTPHHEFGSVYGTYLVLECWSVLAVGLSPEQDNLPNFPWDRKRIVDFLASRQRVDGGLAEVPFVAWGGAPVTAAALASYRLLRVRPEPAVSKACLFLASLQDQSGGFRAACTASAADLLSTAVALLVLHDWEVLSAEERGRAGLFVNKCERPDGGYSAIPDEKEVDVEYTFYGILAQAIVHAQG